uniref:Ubiquitin-like protease family profile domain-containing protein n=1 Tax=Ditylenchus dipsaci TaxID=166011 RepID=A0A915DKH1_9BILA
MAEYELLKSEKNKEMLKDKHGHLYWKVNERGERTYWCCVLKEAGADGDKGSKCHHTIMLYGIFEPFLETCEPTTINGIESFNGQVLRTMAASHPTIWKLIEGLRLELKMAEQKMGAYRAGNNTPRRGIAYRHMNDRLKNVVKRYAEMPKIEFLMAIAANLSCAMIDFSSSANVLEPTRKRHNVDTLPGRGKSVPSSKRQKLDEEVIVCSSDFVQNTKRNSVLLEKEPNSFIAIEKDDEFPGTKPNQLVDQLVQESEGKPGKTLFLFQLVNVRSRYLPETWNVRTLVETNEPKTSNGIESFNGQMIRTMDAHHPTIWKLIEGMQTEFALSEQRVAAFWSGAKVRTRGIAYRDLDDRLKNMVERYTVILDKVAYLKDIAGLLDLDFNWYSAKKQKKPESLTKGGQKVNKPIAMITLDDTIDFPEADLINVICSRKFGIVVTERSLQCLKTDQWLNGDVISFYLQLLAQQSMWDEMIYAFDSFFYPELAKRGHWSLVTLVRREIEEMIRAEKL